MMVVATAQWHHFLSFMHSHGVLHLAFTLSLLFETLPSTLTLTPTALSLSRSNVAAAFASSLL